MKLKLSKFLYIINIILIVLIIYFFIKCSKIEFFNSVEFEEKDKELEDIDCKDYQEDYDFTSFHKSKKFLECNNDKINKRKAAEIHRRLKGT